MAKYIIDSSTLTGLADALRKVNGETRTYTPEEMIAAVTNVLDGAVYILKDEAGNELVGVAVENEVTLDATANDIRIGKVAATATGVTEGTKEIPSYHTTEGYSIITAGSVFSIPCIDGKHDFTKLQAVICPWSGNFETSVAAEKVCLDENIYAVNSTESLATVTRDDDNQAINLGITNESESLYLVRYFTYKEIV